jgi:centrosomal protein CEP104
LCRFYSFPLELGLRFSDGPVRIKQVQILSHQSKIASRVELFVGRGEDYYHADWKRLGYLSLDPNERSQFKSRELKSVYVDDRAHYLKLVVAKPHINNRNVFRQVGIIAINALGEQLKTGGIPDHFTASSSGADPARERRSGSSYDVGKRGSSGSGRGGAGADDLAIDMGLDPETAAMYREIHALKISAVEREDFALAKGYKEAEMLVRSLGGRLAVLLEAKRKAVADEDYDQAAAVKAQIDGIRSEIRARATGTAYGSAPTGPASAAGGMMSLATNAPQGSVLAARPPPQMDGLGMAYGAAGPGPAPSAYGVNAVPRSAMADGGYAGGPVPMVGRPLRPSADGPGGALWPGEHSAVPSAGAAPAGWDTTALERAEQSGAGRPYAGESDPRRSYADHHRAGPGPGEAVREEQRHRPEEQDDSRRSYEARAPPVLTAPSPAENRQLRPAAAGNDIFATAQPGEKAEDDPGRAAATGGPRADPSQLEGADGVAELPEPEQLTAKTADKVGRVGGVFGEYTARALASRHRLLRLAAYAHMGWVVSSRDEPPPGISLRALAEAVNSCAGTDTNAHVFVTACGVLAEAAGAASEAIGPAATRDAVEPALRCFVSHLSDNGAKQRQAAIDGLLTLAECIGSDGVARLCMAPMAPKETNKARPMTSRLSILASLTLDGGLLDTGTVTPGQLLDWSVGLKCHEHKSGEVREGAKSLAVALFKTAGPGVQSRLGHLRGPQREEYEEVFTGGTGGGGEEGRAARGTGRGRGASGRAAQGARAGGRATGGAGGRGRGGGRATGGAGGRGRVGGRGRAGRAGAGGPSRAGGGAADRDDDDDIFADD